MMRDTQDAAMSQAGTPEPDIQEFTAAFSNLPIPLRPRWVLGFSGLEPFIEPSFFSPFWPLDPNEDLFRLRRVLRAKSDLSRLIGTAAIRATLDLDPRQLIADPVAGSRFLNLLESVSADQSESAALVDRLERILNEMIDDLAARVGICSVSLALDLVRVLECHPVPGLGMAGLQRAANHPELATVIAFIALDRIGVAEATVYFCHAMRRDSSSASEVAPHSDGQQRLIVIGLRHAFRGETQRWFEFGRSTVHYDCCDIIRPVIEANEEVLSPETLAAFRAGLLAEE